MSNEIPQNQLWKNKIVYIYYIDPNISNPVFEKTRDFICCGVEQFH